MTRRIRSAGIAASLLFGAACAASPRPADAAPVVVAGTVRDTSDGSCPSAASIALPVVQARVIAPPVGCPPHRRTTMSGTGGAVSRVRQATLFAIDDAQELQRRFACPLFDVKFPAERVASFTTQHLSSTDVQLYGAVRDGDVVRLLFTESTICQGTAATDARTEILVAFERAADGLEAEVCRRPQPACGPVH